MDKKEFLKARINEFLDVAKDDEQKEEEMRAFLETWNVVYALKRVLM